MERLRRIIRSGRLDTDHSTTGRHAAHRERTAGQQPPAPHRRRKDIELRLLGQQFQRGGPLPCDHARVVEGMHHRRTGLLHERREHRLARRQPRLTAMKFSALGEDGSQLHGRRIARRDHEATPAEQPGRTRERCAVVAGRVCGDDPRPPSSDRFVLQSQQRMGRAAVLERTGMLQVLALEVDAAIAAFIQAIGSDDRRAYDPPLQARGRRDHLWEIRQVGRRRPGGHRGETQHAPRAPRLKRCSR